MKIECRLVAPDQYSLTFDGAEVILQTRDIKNLLMQVMMAMTGGAAAAPAAPPPTPQERASNFAGRFKLANDIGIQKFVMASDQADILVLLKVAEKDKPLQDKFYKNMAERLRKILAEDLVYKFKAGITPAQINAAFARLMPISDGLEKNGTLIFGDPPKA